MKIKRTNNKDSEEEKAQEEEQAPIGKEVKEAVVDAPTQGKRGRSKRNRTKTWMGQD